MTDRQDLAELRALLAAAPPGRAVWRSLDAVSGTASFQRFLAAEFSAVTDLSVGPERRGFLKLMAASLALAGLTSCDDPADPTSQDGRGQERPFARNPALFEPGETVSYASVALLDGYANGVLVSTQNGRPLKIEGNPDHPWSRGSTDVFAQASILGLYDPERSQAVRNLGRPSSWELFQGTVNGLQAMLRGHAGEGLRLLTGPITSPTLLAQVAALQNAYPAMHWHSHSAIDRTATYQASERAFGRTLDTHWRFGDVRTIVAFDGEFLDPGPLQAGVARSWSEARRGLLANGALLELHAAGSLPTLTLAKADYPLVVPPHELEARAQALLASVTGGSPVPAGSEWLARAAAALQASRGAGIVMSGPHQPASVQEAVHRINVALGNTGRTVLHTAPVAATGEGLADLVAAMQAGTVQALITLESNPVYDAPGDAGFVAAFAKVPLKIHAGAYFDETAARCDWHLPTTHPLEAWGDARSVDGTVGLMQPMIAPLYNGRSASEVLSLLTADKQLSAQDLVRAQWNASGDPARWEQSLRAGFIAGTASPEQAVTLVPAAAQPDLAAPGGLTLMVRPDPTLWDGSLANNGWLQELPKPLTKIVWDNVITIAPALAERQHLVTGEVVALTVAGQRLEGPVWVLPGQADGTVGVSLGGGRSMPDMLANGVGYNAYAVRAAGSPWQRTGATLASLGRSVTLATTQDHSTMEGHDFVRVQPLGAAPVGETVSFSQPSLYPPRLDARDRAWGMVIDLDACIGCNACVTACQAENNIAVVGREQVAMGREMHWLRIDRYYEGGLDTPATRFQPVPCMHCEDAPCEVGCPVEATLHDHEGLNLMVYNRCVGTRACSGYCPYKVRRFNYLDYSAGAAPTIELQRNPSVTVRARGVMEKCTYCVQRIAGARVNADKSGAPIADGTVQTACQGACPTQAISFGDLNDASSAVAAAKRDQRNYALLGELNVRPRTTYLAALAPGGKG